MSCYNPFHSKPIKREVSPLYLILPFIYIALLTVALFLALSQPIEAEGGNLYQKVENEPSEVKISLTVEKEIRHLATLNNFPVDTALRIADCESKTGKYLYNFEGGSAKGVYMFIDQTWENYCEGEVLNQTDNINCFIKLYPENKDWWKCA